MRHAALAALLCLLSACWISQKPLISKKDAVSVPFEGTFRNPGDPHQSDLTIAPAKGRDYLMSDAKENVSARFLALRDGWYLVQYELRDAERDPDDVGYLYQPFRYVNGQLYIYSPDCEETPGEFKGMERSQYSCDFTRLSALKSAALGYIGRIEAGELGDEPRVWERVSASR